MGRDLLSERYKFIKRDLTGEKGVHNYCLGMRLLPGISRKEEDFHGLVDVSIVCMEKGKYYVHFTGMTQDIPDRLLRFTGKFRDVHNRVEHHVRYLEEEIDEQRSLDYRERILRIEREVAELRRPQL